MTTPDDIKREIYHDLMAKEHAARQRDIDEKRGYSDAELISNLYERIAELKTEITMLMEERDTAERKIAEVMVIEKFAVDPTDYGHQHHEGWNDCRDVVLEILDRDD